MEREAKITVFFNLALIVLGIIGIFILILLSFSGFFQTGKYSEVVLSLLREPFFVVINAALVFAPPISKPMTVTVLVCLHCLLLCLVFFLLC